MRAIRLLLALCAVCALDGIRSGERFRRSNPAFVSAFREIVQPHAASVVRVQCAGKDVCLGVVVGSDGWILTKASDLTDKIQCKLTDGRSLEARLVGIHDQHDLALLKIAAQSLPALKFEHSGHVKGGSWVASVGTGADAVAVGVISVPTRKVYEAFLGVLADGTADGLVIINIAVNSAAHKAGLRPKDVILQANFQRITDPDRFQEFLGEFQPGDTIGLKIRRGDTELDVRPMLLSRDPGNQRAEFQNRLGSELSSRRRGYSVILQHDSILKPADCGSPLVDLKGRVVGINISRAGRVETWAIPGEVIPAVIADLKAGRPTR